MLFVFCYKPIKSLVKPDARSLKLRYSGIVHKLNHGIVTCAGFAAAGLWKNGALGVAVTDTPRPVSVSRCFFAARLDIPPVARITVVTTWKSSQQIWQTLGYSLEMNDLRVDYRVSE